MVCPLGRDGQDRPTEWRGTGELHVLAALEDVKRRFRIDSDRIVCTGLSMGGTGTTYLCSRYPDVFAAGIPLASTYSHISLVANLRDVPMFYVHGGKDWPICENRPDPDHQECTASASGNLWMLADARHNVVRGADRVPVDAETAACGSPASHYPSRISRRGHAQWVEIQAIQRWMVRRGGCQH